MFRAKWAGFLLLLFVRAVNAAPIDDPKSWITPLSADPVGTNFQEIPSLAVSTERRQEAISLLQRDQIVELSDEQLNHFSGGEYSILGARQNRTPFLVRGVIPNNASKCTVGQSGNKLTVFCGGLGDWRYEMRPFLVFLDHRPSRIEIGAMTAL